MRTGRSVPNCWAVTLAVSLAVLAGLFLLPPGGGAPLSSPVGALSSHAPGPVVSGDAVASGRVHGTVAASSHLEWFNKTNRAAPFPQGRNRMVLVDDPNGSQVLLFGGYSPLVSGWLGDTWTYHAGVWTQRSLSVAPSARSNAASYYDPTLGGVVVFGGYTYPSSYYNDTWLYRANNWTRLTPPTAPSPRTEAMMAYDPQLGAGVLYGGYNGTSALNDTWEFDGTTWTPVSTSPVLPALHGGSMAYDAVDRQLVMFSGTLSSGNDSVGTWTFDGGWHATTPGTSPPGRFLGSMATLPNGTAALIMGLNQTGPSVSNTLWLWAGGHWTAETLSPVPEVRQGAGFTYDSIDGYMLLYGGRYYPGDQHLDSDSWALDAFAVHLNSSPVGGLPPFAIAPDANVTGGAKTVAWSWNFGDGTSSTQVAPQHTYNLAGPFDLTLRVTDGLGVALTVNASFSLAIPTSITAIPLASPAGGEAFTAIATNATAPIAYTWSFGDNEIGHGASLTHAYLQPGTYHVIVSSSDGRGATGSATKSVTVVFNPVIFSLRLITIPTQAVVANATTFQVQGSGGTGPYNYTWNFGDGSVGWGAVTSHTYGATGTFAGSVTAHDANGTAVIANFSVSVSGSGTNAPATAPVISTTLLIVIAVAIVAAAGVGAAWALRRSSRRPPGGA